MMTAMLTAKNILTGERKIDVLAVNWNTEYDEAEAAAAESADELNGTPVKRACAVSGRRPMKPLRLLFRQSRSAMSWLFHPGIQGQLL